MDEKERKKIAIINSIDNPSTCCYNSQTKCMKKLNESMHDNFFIISVRFSVSF